jgi:glycosyltransferase involved in cell wall biosynthesis
MIVKRTRKRSTRRTVPRNTSTTPYLSVIIPVMNERRTIAKVIREAKKVHPNTEVIVIVNGSKDGTERIVRQQRVKMLSFDEPLGHDVGRSVGAEMAQGQVLLFIDGDMVISHRQLRPFVQAVAKGMDVALNDYSGPTHKRLVHGVVLSKYVLNIMLSRSDLKGSSMTAVPHAISRRALEVIQAQNLSIPPLAHAMAIEGGLQVEAVHAVNVGRMNPVRVRQHKDPLEKLIMGDHLETIDWLSQKLGARGGFSDFTRKREIVR